MSRGNLIKRLHRAQLYGILDTGYVKESAMQEVTASLLEGGVDVLQFRAKGYDSADVIKLIKKAGILDLCHTHDVPLIINDFPSAAVELGADGLHIGQDDGSLEAARVIVGSGMIVGRSTHSPEQAVAAMREGFDYIGFGPLFPTPTKQGRPGIGLEDIADVQSEVGKHIPVFCIGGITVETLDTVLAAGARRVVIVSALLQADNITTTTRSVRNQLKHLT